MPLSTPVPRFQGTSPNIFYISTGEVVYYAAGVGIVYNIAAHKQVSVKVALFSMYLPQAPLHHCSELLYQAVREASGV